MTRRDQETTDAYHERLAAEGTPPIPNGRRQRRRPELQLLAAKEARNYPPDWRHIAENAAYHALADFADTTAAGIYHRAAKDAAE